MIIGDGKVRSTMADVGILISPLSTFHLYPPFGKGNCKKVEICIVLHRLTSICNTTFSEALNGSFQRKPTLYVP